MADSSEKLIRFADLAQTFHLPVVHLVDCPGFAVGMAAEAAGTIRTGVRAQAAVYQATVPWANRDFGGVTRPSALSAASAFDRGWPRVESREPRAEPPVLPQRL